MKRLSDISVYRVSGLGSGSVHTADRARDAGGYSAGGADAGGFRTGGSEDGGFRAGRADAGGYGASGSGAGPSTGDQV